MELLGFWACCRLGWDLRGLMLLHIVRQIYFDLSVSENFTDSRQVIEEIPNAELTVDLASQTLILPNGSVKFPIDPFSKTCLLNGVDELGYILTFSDRIAEFEQRNAIITN